MKRYSYFPGCSSAEGGTKAYGRSTLAVARALDMELAELEDWNCCGSTPQSSLDELASFAVAARNLALAEAKGDDLLTPCSSCYVILGRTNAYLKEYPALRAKVKEALAAGGLEYRGTVRVRHLLDVLVNDIGLDVIRAKVTKPLAGLKVAAYYGCQVVRPRFGFDNPEMPTSLDNLIAALGAEPVEFPLKSRCCGGSLIISEENIALDLIGKILGSAAAGGADIIATPCPLCQTTLDAYQGRVNRRLGKGYHLPVLFFTQLMGLALGLDRKELGLPSLVVPARKVLAKYA